MMKLSPTYSFSLNEMDVQCIEWLQDKSTHCYVVDLLFHDWMEKDNKYPFRQNHRCYFNVMNKDVQIAFFTQISDIKFIQFCQKFQEIKINEKDKTIECKGLNFEIKCADYWTARCLKMLKDNKINDEAKSVLWETFIILLNLLKNTYDAHSKENFHLFRNLNIYKLFCRDKAIILNIFKNKLLLKNAYYDNFSVNSKTKANYTSFSTYIYNALCAYYRKESEDIYRDFIEFLVIYSSKKVNKMISKNTEILNHLEQIAKIAYQPVGNLDYAIHYKSRWYCYYLFINDVLSGELEMNDNFHIVRKIVYDSDWDFFNNFYEKYDSPFINELGAKLFLKEMEENNIELFKDMPCTAYFHFLKYAENHPDFAQKHSWYILNKEDNLKFIQAQDLSCKELAVFLDLKLTGLSFNDFKDDFKNFLEINEKRITEKTWRLPAYLNVFFDKFAVFLRREEKPIDFINESFEFFFPNNHKEMKTIFVMNYLSHVYNPIGIANDERARKEKAISEEMINYYHQEIKAKMNFLLPLVNEYFEINQVDLAAFLSLYYMDNDLFMSLFLEYLNKPKIRKMFLKFAYIHLSEISLLKNSTFLNYLKPKNKKEYRLLRNFLNFKLSEIIAKNFNVEEVINKKIYVQGIEMPSNQKYVFSPTYLKIQEI